MEESMRWKRSSVSPRRVYHYKQGDGAGLFRDDDDDGIRLFGDADGGSMAGASVFWLLFCDRGKRHPAADRFASDNNPHRSGDRGKKGGE